MGVGDDIAPRFTQKPVLKQEDNGAKLVFQCTLEASPKPDIQWFQGTTPISQSNRIKMRVEPAGGNKYNVMMDIIGVTAADAGTYKVVAKNKLGEVSASINLNFSGKDLGLLKYTIGWFPKISMWHRIGRNSRGFSKLKLREIENSNNRDLHV